MKKSIYLLLIGAVIIASCSKKSESPIEEDPDDEITINVTTSGEAINAGGEQLFTLTGEINKVEFYSGEVGHVYEYRDRTQKELEGEVNVSFIARVMNGYDFERELDAFISTDFTGEYNYEAVSTATWRSITDRFTFPQNNDDGPEEDGRIDNKADIADLIEEGKPFYVGFRYTCYPRPPATRNSRQWRVGYYTLTNDFSGESVSLDHYENAEWTFVTDGEIESGRMPSVVLADGNAVNFLGNQTSTYDGFVAWALSPAHDLFSVDPDEGDTIDSPSTQYRHVYAAPGTYEATFVLHVPDSTEPVIKKIEVTVTL